MKFQPTQQIGNWWCVEQEGAGQIEGEATGKAIAAKVVSAGRKGSAAAQTERRTEIGEPIATVGAEQRWSGQGEPSAAATAIGREEQVLEGFDPGAHRGGRLADYMFLMMAVAKAEQESSVAPSIKRARS